MTILTESHAAKESRPPNAEMLYTRRARTKVSGAHRRTRPRRPTRKVATVLALAFLLLSPAIPLAAGFSLQTTNPGNVFGNVLLGAPASLTAVPSGHDVLLSWPAGTDGSGYSVLGVNNGTSTDCSGASYVSLASP